MIHIPMVGEEFINMLSTDIENKNHVKKLRVSKLKLWELELTIISLILCISYGLQLQTFKENLH